MSMSFELSAKARNDLGKAASRRLRKTGQVPAVLYGGGGDSTPTSVSLRHDDLLHSLEHEEFYTHLLTLDIDGKKESVVLKDLHRHPAKRVVLHADFLRIDKSKKIKMLVPLHFLNEESSHGVKMEGGAVNHLMNAVEISCLPDQLPESIEIDLQEMKLGDSIKLSEMTLPEGVSIALLDRGEEYDQAIVTIQKTRGSSASADDEAEEAGSEKGGEGEAAAEESNE